MERKFRENLGIQAPEQIKINKNAEIIESMLPMIIRDFKWLGENTNLIFTSRYDDIARGIDSVVQLMDPSETWNIGLEIDFTSSEEEMKDKIKKIETRIREGQISSVKYFDSIATGKRRNMKMPKIAFGAPMKEMEEFVSIVAEAYLGKNRELAIKELENHPIRKRFIELTANQLREFGTISAEIGNIDNALLHHGVLERFKQRELIK